MDSIFTFSLMTRQLLPRKMALTTVIRKRKWAQKMLARTGTAIAIPGDFQIDLK